MSFDGHINFGYSTVLTAPSPAASGTTLTLAAGGGALMPATPFNAAVWPTGTGPLMSNAEIVRVTNVSGDDLTIVRAQEGTTAKDIAVGWQFANTITVKNFTDIETAIAALPASAIQSVSAGTTVATGPEIAFSNSNGISFGISTNGVITASHNGITSQSVQTQGSVAILGSTGAISFANGNGITFGGNASTVTASHNGITSQSVQTQSNVQGLSAGTQVGRTGDIAFADSNGISFGMSNSSRITASYTVPSTAGLISAINFSAGTTSNNLSALTFSNSNGVSFGLNGSVVTASVNAAAGGGAAISAGANSQSTGTVNFSNSNNVTFGLSNNGVMTASVTVASTQGSINFSAGTTSNNSSAIQFANSNGISFGLNNGTITATVATNYQSQGAYLTTARASNDAVGLATALTGNGVTWTVNSAGLSLNVPAFLTTAMLSNAATISNIKLSAGTASNNLSAVTFSDVGGVSFGLNGSVITASAPAAAASPVNFSAGTTSGNLGSVVFSNLNGVTFGLNGSTITASVNAGGAGPTMSLYPMLPHAWASSSMYTGASTTTAGGSASTLSFYFSPLILPYNLTFNDVHAIASVAATAAGTGSGTNRHVIGIYTKNANTFSQLTQFAFNALHSQSSVTAQTLSWWAGDFSGSTAASTSRISGNVSASITGIKELQMNATSSASSLSAGHYYIAHAYQFRSTGAALFGMGSAWRHSVSQFTGAIGFSNTTNAMYDEFNGIFSTTVTAPTQFAWNAPSSINTSAITASGGTTRNQWPLVAFHSATA